MHTVSFPLALRQNALRNPDAVALVCGNRELSWTQLDRRSNRLARDYAARGVGDGDFVTIALANGPEFVLATRATWTRTATCISSTAVRT